MGIKQTDLGIFGIKIEIEPDDNYEYLHGKNYTDNSNIYIRRRGDIINFWNVSKSEWDSRDFNFSEMQNKDKLIIIIVTSKTEITLPSKKAAYAELNKGNN